MNTLETQIIKYILGKQLNEWFSPHNIGEAIFKEDLTDQIVHQIDYICKYFSKIKILTRVATLYTRNLEKMSE
jgi:hypothetical protein